MVVRVGSQVQAKKDVPFGITPQEGIPNIAVPEGTLGMVIDIFPSGSLHVEWENGRRHNVDSDEYEFVE